MATPRTFRIPEKALVPLTFSNTEGQTTADLTVTIKAVDPDTGTITTLGTGTGAAPGTAFSVTCDFKDLTPGKRYRLEGAADISGTNPVVVIPNARTAEAVYAEVYSLAIY